MPTRPFHALPAVCAAFLASSALADDGHGHDAAAAPTERAAPRFVGASGAIEVVGIVDGRRLTVFVDRQADNAPVDGARLSVQMAGAPVPLEPHGEGVFDGVLATVPLAGTTVPVTATVVSDGRTETVSATLAMPAETTPDAERDPDRRALAAGAGAAVVTVAAAVWLGRRSVAARRTGGAA